MNINEPVERVLDRIEATAKMLSELKPCPHCHQRFEGHGDAGAGLPRAVGITHEKDCPIEIAFENSPAAEYVIGDDGTIQ